MDKGNLVNDFSLMEPTIPVMGKIPPVPLAKIRAILLDAEAKLSEFFSYRVNIKAEILGESLFVTT